MFLSVILILSVVKHSKGFGVYIECRSLTLMVGRKRSVPVPRDGEPFAALCQIYISLLICKKKGCQAILLQHHMVSATARFLNTHFTCEVAF